MKDNVAQLYENQASWLINESTSTSDSGSFETVVFPIIRRVFSKLLANDIVSVQAMNLPIGKLFYFVPKIQNRNQDSLNTHVAPFGAPNGPTGATTNYNTGKNLYDRFYEGAEPAEDPAGLFDYSKGAYSSMTGVTLYPVIWDGSSLTRVGADDFYTGATTTPTGGFRQVLVEMTGFTSDGQGKLIGPNGNEQDTEEFLSSLQVYSGSVFYNFNVVTQKYGKGIVEYGQQSSTTFPGGKYDDICTNDGKIYLSVDVSSPAAIGSSSLDGYTGQTFAAGGLYSTLTAKYRIYKDMEFEDRIGEVSFDLESVTVSVTERKLRAQWSPELAQDVSAFHNIDAEAELTALLSEQVAAEIDREILRDLRKGAAWTLRWDYNGWKRVSNGSVNYNQKDWNQTLITAINQISAQIHKSTLRGGANWIVVSSEISAIFDDLEYFHVSNAAPDQDQYNMGIERVGTLSGRYQVYRDPYFPPNTVLMGHKGSSLLDTGYVYAPYVPLQLTPTMYNPFNFTPIKGIMTRYAKKMVNNRFYGRIVVDGVRTFDLNSLR